MKRILQPVVPIGIILERIILSKEIFERLMLIRFPKLMFLLRGFPANHSLYAVTKVAQKKMVENFAPELAGYGVTINNVAPGAIRTPRNEKIYEDPKRRAAVEAKIPCGRFGTPEDVSPAVLLLCSNEGSYITGSEIVVDGGMSL